MARSPRNLQLRAAHWRIFGRWSDTWLSAGPGMYVKNQVVKKS